MPTDTRASRELSLDQEFLYSYIAWRILMHDLIAYGSSSVRLCTVEDFTESFVADYTSLVCSYVGEWLLGCERICGQGGSIQKLLTLHLSKRLPDPIDPSMVASVSPELRALACRQDRLLKRIKCFQVRASAALVSSL